VVLLIDSPDFAKQVAKRVKAKLPDLPVVKYVCPTVWSWRPGRAAKMNAYVDHVLAILPFEPEVMRDLGGPETTYIGHPLSRLAGEFDLKKRATPKKPARILIMPGSRKSEASRLLPVLEKSIELLEERNAGASYFLPAVPHLEAQIRKAVENWKIQPEILVGENVKLAAMAEADAAIAASGTAILELAMYGVPCVSIYRPDPALNAVRFLIKAWTGALPNLIADKVIVPERINEFAHPGYIARLVEALLVKGPERQAQIKGFEEVHKKMRQAKPPGEIAAGIIVELANRNRSKLKAP
jgi:lipid-A-disaccharide synthase